MNSKNCRHCGFDVSRSDAYCPSCRESTDEPTVDFETRPVIAPRPLRVDPMAALLESHRSPPTVAHYFRKSLRLRMIQTVLMGTLAGIFWNAGSDEAALGIAGIWLGALLRDFGWFRSSVKLWPTWDAVLDWKRIEQLSAKRESDPIDL